MKTSARVVAIVTLMLAVLLMMAGHGVTQSLLAAGLVLVQGAGGVTLWTLVQGPTPERHDGADSLAIGLMIGIAMSAFSTVFCIGTPLAPVGWALPSLVVVAVAVVRRRRIGIAPVAASSGAWIALSLVVGLSTEWTWLTPSVIVTIAVCAGTQTGPWHGRTPLGTVRRSVWALLALAAGGVQIAVLRLRSPAWIQFRQSVLDVPDHVFFDGLSLGVARWGAQGTAVFVSGLDAYGYHWLPYLWSGTVVSLSSGYSAAMSSHLIQVVSVGAVAILFSALVVRLGGTSFAGYAGAVAVAALVAQPSSLFQSLAIYSPSHVMSVATIFALVLVRATRPTSRDLGRLMVLAVLSAAAVGFKLTALVPIVAVAGADGIRGLVRPGTDRRPNRILRATCMAVPALLSTLYFLGKRPRAQSDSAPSWFQIVSSDGPLAEGQHSEWLIALGLCGIVAGLVATVPGLVLTARGRFDDRDTAVTLGLAAIATVCAGFAYTVIVDAAEVSYFFVLATALAAPIGVAAMANAVARTGRPTARWYWATSVCAVALGAAWTNLYAVVPPTSVSRSVLRSMLLMTPLLFGVFVGLLTRSGRRTSAVAIATVLVSLSSYVVWVPRYTLLHLREGTRIDASDILTGRREYRDVLTWLRLNSSPDDVVATNRYCALHEARFPDCSATWSLVTAVTGRRTLVEVPDFMRKAYTGIEDRVVMSIAFVDAPSGETAAKLSTASVTWVYVDKAVTDARSWEPWARVEYENDLAAVLRLLP